MNNNETEGLRWYLQGAKDRTSAEKNGRGGDFEVSCFLFQQAAEKMLKAFLLLRGERGVVGHSTHTLRQACEKHDVRFTSLKEPCLELDPYYLATRYPFALPGGMPYEFFTLQHAQRAADACEDVYRLVYEHFKDLVAHVG
jgi:HEPN domain-containing protein